MSATLYLTKALPAYPFSLRWVAGISRPRFDSILASFVGPYTGTLTQYHGPVCAWLEYQEPETGKFRHSYTLMDIVFGDSESRSQCFIQFELRLPSPITVKSGAAVVLHFSTPLSGRVPAENATFSATAWDVSYGIRGNYN